MIEDTMTELEAELTKRNDVLQDEMKRMRKAFKSAERLTDLRGFSLDRAINILKIGESQSTPTVETVLDMSELLVKYVNVQYSDVGVTDEE